MNRNECSASIGIGVQHGPEYAKLEDIPVHASRGLYHAGLTTLLGSIRSFDDSYSRVMLIGHNLGLESLLLHLCPDAPVMSNGKLLTTANIAVVDLPVDIWESFGEQASLLTLLRPKEIDATLGMH